MDSADQGTPASTIARAAEPSSHALTPGQPGLTVIVPVRNDPSNLEQCLRALQSSRFSDFEVVVVDDASTDATAEVAHRAGVRLLSQETRTGPAAARNRGAEHAKYSHLFFVDADVRVQPDTLDLVWARFADDPGVDALFGSYDTRPGAPNLLSQYRNLLHHHVHQAGRENAFSFWSGCGAIKRSAFRALGGFDTGYDNASVEDIELGSRLRQHGFRVVLDKSIQVQHLKRWTFLQMVQTDIQKRGVPWTLLLLRQGRIPNDLNLRYSQRLSALLAGGLALALGLGSWFFPAMLLVPVVTVLAILALDRWSRTRPIPRWAQWTLVGVAAVGAGGGLQTPFGRSLLQGWSLAVLVCLVGIVVLNLPFYRFLLRVKHPLFALLAVPLQVLYYLYSGLAFAIGLVLHLGRRDADVPTDPGTGAENGAGDATTD